MRKRIAQTDSPDSLYQKGTSGEYNLQIKSVTETSGKYEYVLVDADLHEYKVITTDQYPVGKLLRCMVRFKIRKGSLLLEKIGVCRVQKQFLMPRQDNEEDNRHKVKKSDSHTKRSEIAETDPSIIIEDVKKLLEAKESGLTNGQLKSEIIRLHNVIVNGQLKDAVIEGCGEESLKKVWGMARSLRRKEKKVSDKKKLDNTLRTRWLKWFIGSYGINGNSDMEEKLYDAILKSAYYLNFVELQNACKTDAQFYQNGLADCYKIAIKKNYYSPKPEKKRTRTRKKRAQNSYSSTGSPHITRKDWGSAYRPGRG